MREIIRVQSSQQVPILFETDVLVIGGGLAGLAAASDLADAGRQVVLIESETFLGYELSAWQRPWLRWRTAKQDLLCAWFPVETAANTAREGDIIPLHMNSLKLKLEDRLLSRGVRLLYASRPVGYRKDGKRWIVVIGNKSGRQAISADQLIDATEHGVMAYLGGKGAAPDSTFVRRTVEFTDVTRGGVQHMPVPAELGVAGSLVTVYPGGFSDTHVYVDVPLELARPVPRSSKGDCEVELFARTKSLEVAEYLTHNVAAFAEATIGLGSLQVMRSESFDPVAALVQGGALAQAMLANKLRPEDCHLVSARGRESVRLPDVAAGAVPKGEVVTCNEESEFAQSWAGKMVVAPLGALPTLAEVDVLVAGGGTSGAPAAYTAGREGVSVAVVEMNSRLGGTGTLGAINEHWMSFPNPFCDEIDQRIEEWEDRVRFPKSARRFDWHRTDQNGNRYHWGGDRHWSIEVKAQVLEEMCREAGVALYFDSLLIGSLVDGDKVLGAVVATPYGPRAVLGKVTIDATGDGDVAAFAGAEHSYGNRRDRLTQWTAIAFYRTPGGLGNNHIEAGDIGDIFDYTRFILTNRRRGKGIHDHGTYVAPRESRHILGEVTNSLVDQLMLRRYPDTAVVMFSNWDMKGLWFADIVDFGINPPHEEIEIPYRALIPRRLEQLIIAGKAFSLTHDACAAPRMQRDLILLGGAVGLAAAFATKDAVSPRRLDVSKLQRRMVDTGNMPARVLEYTPPAPPDLRALVNRLTGEEPLEWQEMLATEKATSVSPVIQLCCADPAEVTPLLQKAFRDASGPRRLLLARLLLWHRCTEGADAVLGEINRQLGLVAGLPQRVGDIDWSTGSPEQAIQPEIIFLVNMLVRLKDPRVVPLMREFVTRIARVDRDYRDIRTGIFDYIRMVATAAERMPSPEFVPLLKKLLELPDMREVVCPASLELDHFKERRTYLILALARALARCGRKDGLMELAHLLADPRTLYARSAHAELKTLTGLDLPFGHDVWKRALVKWPETFAPMLWEGDLA